MSIATLTDVYALTQHNNAEAIAVRGVTAEFDSERFTAILSTSGSANETILRLISGFETPDSGTVKTLDHVVNTMDDDERSALRRDSISVLLPLYNLVGSLSIGQNLTLGHSINRIAVDQHKYKQVLAAFNLSDIEKIKAKTLDTATQLRVAIARSVLRESEVVLCADPTINSSIATVDKTMALLRQCVREFGMGVILATHDPRAAVYADRVLLLIDGKLTTTVNNPSFQSLALALENSVESDA